MDLLKNIIIKVLEENEISISGLEKIIENRCCEALARIIKIIKTPELDDKECFIRIEKIVVELENLGFDCGNRHDFG